MPKIYEYFGILFFFYAEDHYPIHVHAAYGNKESVFEFIMKDGKITNIIRRHRSKTRELPPTQLRQATDFVWAKRQQILDKWIASVVKKGKAKLEYVTRKV